MGIWSWFVSLLEQLLLWFSIFAGSASLGIILFTLVARITLLPLTLTSIRSSRKMQELQPMIKELQRKHGKDAKKLQEETVKLYQQYKINPVGGCLPMLLQLPIFIGVYQAVIHLMVPQYEQYRSAAVQQAFQDPAVAAIFSKPFLGIIDLGVAPFADGGFNGIPYLVLPVLSIVLQFMQQLMAMPRVQDPQQKAMTQAMMFMPLVFGYIAFTFPAGAVLYWVTSSLIGVVQQYFTSGWGSLANYLKFLPPDRRSRTASSAAMTAAPANALPEGEVVASEGGTVAVSQRSTFWDVLRPLTEGEATESPAAGTTTDAATEQAIEAARSGGNHATNPRRPRRRR